MELPARNEWPTVGPPMAGEKYISFADRLSAFPAEWREFWQSLPMRWVLLALSAVWVGWFFLQGNSTLGYVNTSSLFSWWIWVHTRGVLDDHGSFSLNKFMNSDTIHVWFVPPVVFLLLWSRRQVLKILPKRVCWPAVGLLLFAIVLHLAGFMVQQTRLSVVALVVGLYALMGWVWGPRWMGETLFPFFLFAFSVPMGTSGELITFPLRNLSAELSTLISKWVLGMDVFRDGTSILSANGRFQYDVAPACSGIRSLVTLLALTTIFGYLTFTKLWKRLLMVLLAAPLAVAGNTLRITCAVLVGEVFGHDAGARIEQNLGFLTFLLALAILLLVARWLREKPDPAESTLPASSAVSLPDPPAAPPAVAP